MEKLTAKQQKFVNAYLRSGNATQAAVQAGYSKKTARFVGAENLTKPYIKKIINDRQKKAANKADFSLEQWVQAVKKLAEKSERDSDRLKAWDMLGKHLGAYERDNKLSIDVKSMSAQEVEKLADQLIKKL